MTRQNPPVKAFTEPADREHSELAWDLHGQAQKGSEITIDKQAICSPHDEEGDAWEEPKGYSRTIYLLHHQTIRAA